MIRLGGFTAGEVYHPICDNAMFSLHIFNIAKTILYSLRHVVIGDLTCIARCNKINPALVFNLIISGKLSAT